VPPIRTTRKPPLKVRRSSIHGSGAFATRRIREGTRVIEYVGERISYAEAVSRYDDDSMQHHHTFLFEVGPDLVVDAGRQGNDARFINHSCDPNCMAYLDGGRIFIEAIKNIQPGVELTYDYALTREGLSRKKWRDLYACRCGAANCRGTILKRLRRRVRKPASAKRVSRRNSTKR
jgi:SET domain-containing protein